MFPSMAMAVLLSFLSPLCQSAHGAEADAQQRLLIEGAKKEGRLVFYTSVETEFARSLSIAFEAKYPFIKTDIFRSTHEKILSRMNVERKTGTYTADTVSVGEFETYHMQKMGFIAPYKSPFAAAYPEGFKEPNGYWTDLYDNLIVTAYNTQRVSVRSCRKATRTCSILAGEAAWYWTRTRIGGLPTCYISWASKGVWNSCKCSPSKKSQFAADAR